MKVVVTYIYKSLYQNQQNIAIEEKAVVSFMTILTLSLGIVSLLYYG